MKAIPQEPFIYAAVQQMSADVTSKPQSLEILQEQVLPYLHIWWFVKWTAIGLN